MMKSAVTNSAARYPGGQLSAISNRHQCNRLYRRAGLQLKEQSSLETLIVGYSSPLWKTQRNVAGYLQDIITHKNCFRFFILLLIFHPSVSPRAHLHVMGMLRLMFLTEATKACPLLFILFSWLFLSYGPFNCISFHKFSRQLSAFSLCFSGLTSALLVLSTI